jgi:hypothetical protein
MLSKHISYYEKSIAHHKVKIKEASEAGNLQDFNYHTKEVENFTNALKVIKDGS